MKMFMKKPLSLLTACVLPAFSTAAYSAAAPEEIVVTAQRRAESIQEVPISISAFTGESLENVGANSLADLENVTPGLTMGQFSGMFQPVIRGVGSTIFQPGADASVATFVDGYYMAFIQGTMQDLFDAERVEILKGPQASLYGRNATGGAINFVSKAPYSSEFAGKVSAGYGSDDETELKLYVTGPLSDTLAASFAGVSRKRDSYVDYINAPSGSSDEESTLGGRLKLLWQPNNIYQVELAIAKSKLESLEAQTYIPLPGTVWEAELLGGQVGSLDHNKQLGNDPIDSVTDQNMYFLTQEAEFGNGFTLRSLTGYVNTQSFNGLDIDGSPLPLLYSSYDFENDQYSQEFQLMSDPDQSFSWTVGATYFKAYDENDPLTTRLTVASQLLGFFETSQVFSKLETETVAFYAEGDYDITDRLTVALGVRSTEEEKTIDDSYVVLNGIPNPSPYFDCTFAGLTFGVNCGGAAYGLPDIPPAFVGAGSTLNGVRQPILKENETWEEITYKFSVNYQATDTINLYYSYGHGFKSAVYNLVNLIAGVPNPPVNPEEIDSHEIGMKSDLLDGALRLNVAIFDYSVSENQAQVVVAGTGGAGLVALSSAGDASIYGGEVEATFAATDRLSLNMGLSYLHSEYDEFDNYPSQQEVVPGGGTTGVGGNGAVATSVIGNPLPRSPEYTANLSALYEIPLTSGSIKLTGLVSYNDGYCIYSDCDIEQDAYTLVNGSISYTTIDEKIMVTLWGNNLTSEEYYRQLLEGPTGDGALLAREAYGGVRVQYNF